MLYTTEIYLAALLYKILQSFLQREITSAHGGCFFPFSNCSSKKLSTGTHGMYLRCERNQAADQMIQNDGVRLATKKGSCFQLLKDKT